MRAHATAHAHAHPSPSDTPAPAAPAAGGADCGRGFVLVLVGVGVGVGVGGSVGSHARLLSVSQEETRGGPGPYGPARPGLSPGPPGLQGTIPSAARRAESAGPATVPSG